MTTMNITNVVLDFSRLYAFYSERFVDLLLEKLNGWEKLIELAITTHKGGIRDLNECVHFVKTHYEEADINDREYRLICDIGTFIASQIRMPIDKVIHADCEVRHNHEWYSAELYIGFV